MNHLQLKILNSRKGMLLFVVVATLFSLGILIMAMNWQSRALNHQTHKTYFNHTAELLAEGVLNTMIQGFRDSIKIRDDFDPGTLPADSGKNFYNYFLSNKNLLDDPGEVLELSHREIEKRLEDRYIDALENMLKDYKGSTYEMSMNFTREAELIETPLRDPLQRMLRVEFVAKASFRGSTKSRSVNKKFQIYNLLAPVTSKFTFFHKNNIGGKYNRVFHNHKGKILQGNGPEQFQLSMQNCSDLNSLKVNGIHREASFARPRSANDCSDPIKHPYASQLSRNEGDITYLKDAKNIEVHRKKIKQRGYQFFGTGMEIDEDNEMFVNSLKLIPGLSNAGEYYLLYPPELIDANPPWQVSVHTNKLPNSIKKSRFLENLFPDAKSVQSLSKICIRQIYDGFYVPSAGDDISVLIKKYNPAASLFHPFGNSSKPSKTYVVGKTYREYARKVTIEMDRDRGTQDEESLERITGEKVDPDDAVLFQMKGLSEEEFKQLQDEKAKTVTVSNRNYLPESKEPPEMRLGPEYHIKNLIQTYEDYFKFMSRNVHFPINHTLNFPFHSKDYIPPEFDPEFLGYIFGPRTGNSIPAFDSSQMWTFDQSRLQAKGEVYLDETANLDNVNQLLKSRVLEYGKAKDGPTYLTLRDKKGIDLTLREPKYFLFGSSKANHQTEMEFLVVGNAVVVESMALRVQGDCYINNIVTASPGIYFHLSCNKIYLGNAYFKPTMTHHTLQGQFDSRTDVVKLHKKSKISIRGNLSVGSLNSEFFQGINFIDYNQEFDPLGPNHDFFYRMILGEENLEWSNS